MAKAAAKKAKKTNKRERKISDIKNFPFGDKVEVRNPLIPKGKDEEN